MFIYLSKKIAIPNQTRINALAWNKGDGYIAVGGEGGLLKVFKLDTGAELDTNKNKSVSVTSNLSLNQTLEGHNDSIKVLVWNEPQKKLTTSDSTGVIIVWMMYKGSWYEEMINNRKKSTVIGMSWSSDGLKICIIYEDGAVIVGSVDGNKIWGKELKTVRLCCVQWSPDGKLLLFGLKTGQVHVYDNQGTFIKKLPIYCLSSSDEEVSTVCIDWYSGKYGYMHYLCPNLAICFENGKVQIMCNESGTSETTVVLNTGMIIVNGNWNHNGSLLAVTGRQKMDEKLTNLVQFYNPLGEHLRTLKVPGISISCCVWEGGSLRVALAVDSSIYFANIRPDYKWCYFKNTLVYTSCVAHKPGLNLTFWDIVNDQVHSQHVSAVLAIAGCEDHCVISVPSNSAEETGGKYGLLLCNAVGTPIDGKYINIEPIFVAMSSTYVVAASKQNFLIWQYKTPKSIGVEGNKIKCTIFHIDDTPLGTTNIIQDLDDTQIVQTARMHATLDPICCLACSNKCLMIGRESGMIQYYALPHVVLTKRFKVHVRPHKMAINCSSTKMSVIDVSGMLTVLDISDELGRQTGQNESSSKFERKDVWSMCWASDNPQLIAIMEKTRMYIFKGNSPEEPIACTGYIYSFNELQVQSVLLDELTKSPEKPMKSCLVKVEVKSLRDTRLLLEKVGLAEAESFIEDNQHPRLWCLLGEAALKTINLEVATSAFIRAKEYAKVLFVKKLSEFNNKVINKGKVSSYFKNFDEAEKIYLEADRSDLALDLRQMLGDWFRVIQILKNGAQASDEVLENAYGAIAFFFKDSNNYSAAAEYFEMAKNVTELVECYYFLEEYDKLASYINILSEGDPCLKRIGDMFAMQAVHSEAVRAYIKFGNVKPAIDLCVRHNRWDAAIELAKKYNIEKISEYFTKYTEHLVEQNKVYQAIDVNVQAKFYLQASTLAYQFASKISKKKGVGLIDKKKHFVYGGKLLELHSRHSNSEMATGDREIFFNQWRGAEAYHYFMLAQEQLYNGKLHDALCTVYKLQNYDDLINLTEIYSLYAFIACLNRAFGLCSRAFIKLKKGDHNMSSSELKEYIKLSWEVFLKNGAQDLRVQMVPCFKCNKSIPYWSTICTGCQEKFTTCVASGKPLIEGQSIWECKECKHKALSHLMNFFKNCPLCHCPIN